MSQIISLKRQIESDGCSQPLKTLFQKYAVVLVGDELGAFYLDKWACGVDEYDTTKDPFYPWDRRSLLEANTMYMAFVYAAYEDGIRDIVIDMAPSMQPGIDKGLGCVDIQSVHCKAAAR